LIVDPGASSPTPVATITPVPATPTATPQACAGDCNGDRFVSVAELIQGVNIALGRFSPGACPRFDRDGNGRVEVSELVAAVRRALDGCAT